jgi:signal transduction histidine kinase
LGLPITQWLVNVHHGRIWFESKVGIGTKFHVILPVVQPAEETEDLESSEEEPTSASTN